MYEFFVFTLDALGWFAVATAALWAGRLTQFAARGHAIAHLRRQHRNYQKYVQESQDVLRAVLVGQAPHEDTLLRLINTDPQNTDKE